jgi:endo-1,4-beta-xylanase
MTDVPGQQAQRSRVRLLLGGIAAAVLVATVAIVPGVAHADTTVTTSQTGTHNGYFYIFRKDAPGTATMTLGNGGRYVVEWSGVNSLYAGKGWSTGGRRSVAYYSTFNTTGNAYVGINGWTTNPLVEYNIVENWGTWRPAGGVRFGTVVTDGGVYEVFRTVRVNQLSILGLATYYQYWSVRTTKRAAGVITTGNHFDAWANFGLNLGTTHNYMVLATTAYQCSGRADVTIAELAR